MLRIGRSRIKGIVGITLIIIAIAIFFYWENVGREKYTCQEVIVLNQSIEANTEITADMIDTRQIDKKNVIEGRVIGMSEIVGKEAVCYIPKGLQLSPKFFLDKQLNPGDGEKVLEIPSEWLYAFPQTLRRGDKVYFHTVKAKQNDDYNTGVINLDEQISTDVEKNNLAILEATVAYVKDSSNREVVDVIAERMDGSASISKVEIITNDAGYETLKHYYENGCQFIIMYD